MLVKTKIYIGRLTYFFKNLNKKYVLIFAASLPAILVIGYSIAFFWPKQINYTYHQEKTCFSNPTFLPNSVKVKNKNNFQISYHDNLKLAGKSIYSSESCLKIVGISSNQATEYIQLSPLGNPLLSQKIKVDNQQKPMLASTIKPGQLTSTKETLKLKLNQADKTFSYKVSTEQNSSKCQVENNNLNCSLADLNLEQSKTYSLKFERLLAEKLIETIYETSIKTVDPILITGQSIAPGSTVFDSPKVIEVTTSKPIKSYKDIELVKVSGNTEAKADTEISLSNNKVIIKPAAPLSRESTYRLFIKNLEASDKGFLPDQYKLEFSTSGGPNVSNVNIGTYGVGVDSQYVLSFDYELLAGQDISRQISVITNSGALSITTFINGSKLTIKPNSNLPRCTPFTIRLQPGIKNLHGIESSKGWSLNSRTICQEIFSIGTSYQGRPITGYKFGSGPSKVIYIGATHGDEKGSKYLLDSWTNELEANFTRIPAHRTIIVVPMLNPDGFAAGSRVNARNVDLNRNFPADNWKADVKMPGGNVVPGGGGTESLSEPESKAIANFIISQSPRLVLTYHSKGSLVVANEAGDSVGLAGTYGRSSGYMATSESKLGTTFSYDTTGAMENWLNDKHKLPALLIELSTHSSNEFYKNKFAMWSMATL